MLIDVFYNVALMHWNLAGNMLQALEFVGAVREVAGVGPQGGPHKNGHIFLHTKPTDLISFAFDR